jgi:hypothetical protein
MKLLFPKQNIMFCPQSLHSHSYICERFTYFLGIYKSLTDTWMWKWGAAQIPEKGFSLQCLVSNFSSYLSLFFLSSCSVNLQPLSLYVFISVFFHLFSPSPCLFSLNLSFLYYIFYGVSLEVSILHTSLGNQKEIKLWKAFILCFYVSQKGRS